MLLLWALPCWAVGAQSLTVVTEASPFTERLGADQEGAEATAFVEMLIAQAGLSADFRFLPWRRAYRLAQSERDTLIYPIARTPQRETRFHWIGRLIPVRYYLFKLRARKDIQLSTLRDAAAYRIGVVNAHVHHEYLQRQGFSRLQSVNDNAQNVHKALLGRIDLFPLSDGGLLPVCEREKVDCSLFEPLLELTDISGGLYLAANPDIAPDTLQRLRESYQTLTDKGLRDTVFARRLRIIQDFYRQWPVIGTVKTAD